MQQQHAIEFFFIEEATSLWGFHWLIEWLTSSFYISSACTLDCSRRRSACTAQTRGTLDVSIFASTWTSPTWLRGPQGREAVGLAALIRSLLLRRSAG